MRSSLFLAPIVGSLLASPSLASDDATRPKNFGVILFRAMEMQDMWGPVDPLQLLAHEHQLNLYLLAETMDPVTSEPAMKSMNPHNSSFWPTQTPTHTFATAPPLDVLIVPGGPGARMPNATAITNFIAKTYPSLQYLFTVCTGAGFAAQAGVLDGRRATTNKGAWKTITAMGPKVKWVAPARWVVDGNIWSSSGVMAGLDMTYAFITQTWGAENATWAQGLSEYLPHTDPCYDPFSARFNVSAEYHLEGCT